MFAKFMLAPILLGCTLAVSYSQLVGCKGYRSTEILVEIPPYETQCGD